LRQNCIRSWPNHQLRTEAKAKNPSLERTRPTLSPPLPQVSRPNVSRTRPKSRHTQLVSRPVPRPVGVERPDRQITPASLTACVRELLADEDALM
jgi:hypothetical protein